MSSTLIEFEDHTHPASGPCSLTVEDAYIKDTERGLIFFTHQPDREVSAVYLTRQQAEQLRDALDDYLE